MLKPEPFSSRAHCVRQAFSLVELMVALMVMALMALMLLRITQVTQGSLSKQRGRERVYRPSRAVLDVIQQDLEGMRISDVAGREIGLHIYSHDGQSDTPDDWRVVTFVAATAENNAQATAQLSEITYIWHEKTASGVAPATRWRLARHVVCDKLDDGTDDARWDFLGLPADWHDNITVYDESTGDTLADAVSEFSLTFYDSSGAILGAGDDTTMPHKAILDVTLFNPALKDIQANEPRLNSERKFSKVIRLDPLQN